MFSLRYQVFLRCGLCALLAVLATGCQTVQTTQTGTVGIDRVQRVSSLVNRDDLARQASLQYAQTLKEADKAVNADPAMTEKVRAIAARLIEQTPVFRPDAKQWDWEINVIQSEELNAWCMPGGKIAIYSGMIDRLKLSDDEVAAVTGHEIAHALREHSWEKASEIAVANVGLGVLGALAGSGYSTAGGLLYTVMFQLPNSREMETESDRIGVELAARAAYHPKAAISLWQKMAQAGSAGVPPFLSTHPSSESRQADLERYAQIVMPLYEQAVAERTKALKNYSGSLIQIDI
ncbi:MAG: M48 family metallopeptidase [Burkholderiales bacterium]|jgi:predicted Zn-dependent protease|nr:M48 family metallopeptidase [Burkholderiales bacterium]